MLNKTYKINKDLTKVNEAVCDDVKFRNINALLESFANDEGVLSYSWKSGFDTCKVVIKEAEEKGEGASIGLVGTYAELEEVEERLMKHLKMLENGWNIVILFLRHLQ